MPNAFSVCIVHVCTRGGQKSVSEPLELKLQAFASCNQTPVLEEQITLLIIGLFLASKNSL